MLLGLVASLSPGLHRPNFRDVSRNTLFVPAWSAYRGEYIVASLETPPCGNIVPQQAKNVLLSNKKCYF